MRINNYIYVNAHGKLPKGKRDWYFQPGDGAGHVYPETGYALDMSYADAKKWAQDHFSGYCEVYVLP